MIRASCTETAMDEDDPYRDYEEEPACDYCHGDGGDPLCDYVLPCPYCGYLSASSLSHAEMPLRPALRLYRDFSAGVQRNSTRSTDGFLTGGLPRGRLGLSMAHYSPYRKDLTRGADRRIICPYTI